MFPNLDLYTISIIASVLSAILVLAVKIWLDRKPKAYILRKTDKGYYKVGTVNLTENSDCFFYRNRAYKVEWDKVAFFNPTWGKHVPVLVYELNHATPLPFTPNINPHIHDSEKLHLFVKKRIVEQLVRASNPEHGFNWLFILIFILAGIGIGITIGLILHPYVFPLPAPTTSPPPTITPP